MSRVEVRGHWLVGWVGWAADRSDGLFVGWWATNRSGWAAGLGVQRRALKLFGSLRFLSTRDSERTNRIEGLELQGIPSLFCFFGLRTEDPVVEL